MSIDTLANKGRTVNILLVEDNYGDVLLTREAFHTSRIHNTIEVAQDGEKAMEMLRKEGEYADTPTPDMILLDLNLPKKDGKEVLAEIKGSEALKRIPVAILTSSRAEEDVIASYNLHASSYIIKPTNFDNFTGIVTAIENFWFNVAVMSNGQEASRRH